MDHQKQKNLKRKADNGQAGRFEPSGKKSRKPALGRSSKAKEVVWPEYFDSLFKVLTFLYSTHYLTLNLRRFTRH
jgi:hypothetical protein